MNFNIVIKIMFFKKMILGINSIRSILTALDFFYSYCYRWVLYDVISVVDPKWFYLYGSHPEKKKSKRGQLLNVQKRAAARPLNLSKEKHKFNQGRFLSLFSIKFYKLYKFLCQKGRIRSRIRKDCSWSNQSKNHWSDLFRIHKRVCDNRNGCGKRLHCKKQVNDFPFSSRDVMH